MEREVADEVPQELEFGKYRFDSILGQGGEGIAIKYIRLSDQMPVAVKMDPV